MTVCQGVFRGLQDMRTPLAVTAATNVLHLVLSLALIFPPAATGWEGLGLTGAAWSTSVAEWLAAGRREGGRGPPRRGGRLQTGSFRQRSSSVTLLRPPTLCCPTHTLVPPPHTHL